MLLPRIFLCCALAATLSVFVGCDRHAKDREEITNAFRDFQLAVNNSAGEDAASFLSTEGLDWYDRMLALARDATSSKVHSLRPIEKSSVLEIRNRLTRNQTDRWTGRDYFVYGVGHGWWAHKGESPWTLRSFRYRAGEASAEVVIDDEPTGYRVRFVMENAAWKYDDTSINELMNDMIEMGADDEDLSLDEALVKWEGRDGGKVPGPGIWEPMK